MTTIENINLLLMRMFMSIELKIFLLNKRVLRFRKRIITAFDQLLL